MTKQILIPTLTGGLGLAVGLLLGTSFPPPNLPTPVLESVEIITTKTHDAPPKIRRTVPAIKEPMEDPQVARLPSKPFLERALLALEISDADARNAELVELSRAWSSVDPTAAEQWALALPTGSSRAAAIRALAETLARSDARAALEFALNHLEEPPNHATYHNIVAEWVRQDPVSTLGWTTSLGEEGNTLSAIAISNVPEDSFHQVVSVVVQMPDTPHRSQLLSRLATTWSSRDREGALAWAQGLPMSSKGPVLESIAAEIGSQDPGAAAALIDQIPATSRPTAVAALAGQWGNTDPRSASQWLMSRQNESEQRVGVEQLISNWARQNRVEAAEWLNSLPIGATRDAAVVRFVGFISASDPQSAAAYAETISDPEERQSRLVSAVKTWKRTDPALASQWVQAANLPATLKQQLLK